MGSNHSVTKVGPRTGSMSLQESGDPRKELPLYLNPNAFYLKFSYMVPRETWEMRWG